MKIPVMLTDGRELSVSKDQLQTLLSANRVLCFERSDRCVFIGYDKMRSIGEPYTGEDRRERESFLAF